MSRSEPSPPLESGTAAPEFLSAQWWHRTQPTAVRRESTHFEVILYYCGYVTQRSNLQIAALASAALPSITVSGVRGSRQSNSTDVSTGIDQAIVLDTTGHVYDVYASSADAGKARLQGRARAAQALEGVRQASAFSFALDRVLAFESGSSPEGPTGMTAVLVATHHEGESRQLDLLTINDCTSVGTAIGAFQRLDQNFLKAASYPVFTTGQIRSQLTGWIRHLRQAGQVPSEITRSWAAVIETDGLWSFATCPVHGGFHDGDFLFSGSSITAVTNWQDMQVNDPARDLSWIFAKLDDQRRNAILTAYGRMIGSRLDDLIMLRANLWLQMEQVGDFIQALNRADNDRIIQYKAQVERLAHQLGVATSHAQAAHQDRSSSGQASTITVGTLLDDGRRGTGSSDRNGDQDVEARENVTDERDITNDVDITNESDVTGESPGKSNGAGGSQNLTPAGHAFTGGEDEDSTARRPVVGQVLGSTANSAPNASAGSAAGSSGKRDPGPESATVIIRHSDASTGAKHSASGAEAPEDGEAAQTALIPRAEREAQARHDARADLDASKDDDTDEHTPKAK